MIIQLLTLLLTTLCVGVTHADSSFIKSSGFTLNPKLNLKSVHADNRNETYRSGDLEVSFDFLPLHDPAAVKKAAEVNFVNIKSLYEPQRSPYRGQITKLVQCDSAFRPVEFGFTLKGRETPVIVGGANSRKQIGACARADIKFWSAYFNVQTASGDLLTARTLIKVENISAGKARQLTERLKHVVEDLLSPDSAG
jgi:hypothetical protein